jgi:hypothetical protein
MKKFRRIACATLISGASVVQAAEIGHYAPGVVNIRDFAVPEPGLYGVLYTYAYTTDRLNDADGNEVGSVTIRPGQGPGVGLDVNVDVDAWVLSPTLIWISQWTLLGAKYGAYISLPFGNTSLGASLSAATGSGRRADESQFGASDLFIQPLWLGWTKERWDFAFGYGLYAPTGAYDTETLNLPIAGPVTVEAADNIGYGFWSHQFQGAATWYPWADRRMAVVAALTYEINEEKDDFDLTPGEALSLNWGVSQYLPLREDQSLLLELGLTGYSSWQVSNDSGADVTSAPLKDEVHAVGAQVGLTHVPLNGTLNFHYFYEFDAKDRFQGQSIGLNLALKF